MMVEKKISEKPVTLTEIREMLSERKKDKELSYEQDLALKYAKRFAKLSLSQAEKAREELSKIGKLDEFSIVKIIDVLPQSREILELVIPKNIAVDADDAEKILDVTKKYAK